MGATRPPIQLVLHLTGEGRGEAARAITSPMWMRPKGRETFPGRNILRAGHRSAYGKFAFPPKSLAIWVPPRGRYSVQSPWAYDRRSLR
jgi:hypothetical protein